jgi:Protein of unknown function (DUF2917)
MHPTTPERTLRLARHHSLHLKAPVALQARAGTLWVTIDGDPQDIVLEAGEARCFDAPAALLVHAIAGDATLRVRPLAPARRRGLADWFARRFGDAVGAPAIGAGA